MTGLKKHTSQHIDQNKPKWCEEKIQLDKTETLNQKVLCFLVDLPCTVLLIIHKHNWFLLDETTFKYAEKRESMYNIKLTVKSVKCNCKESIFKRKTKKIQTKTEANKSKVYSAALCLCHSALPSQSFQKDNTRPVGCTLADLILLGCSLAGGLYPAPL